MIDAPVGRNEPVAFGLLDVKAGEPTIVVTWVVGVCRYASRGETVGRHMNDVFTVG